MAISLGIYPIFRQTHIAFFGVSAFLDRPSKTDNASDLQNFGLPGVTDLKFEVFSPKASEKKYDLYWKDSSQKGWTRPF